MFPLVALALCAAVQANHLAAASVRTDSRVDQIESRKILEQFDLTGERDSIIVPVRLDGKAYPFLLDTGATTTIFDTALASHLGPRRGEVEATTYGDRSRIRIYDAPQARLGGINLAFISRVGVMDLKRARESLGCDVAGILGMDVLSLFVIHYDPDRKKLCVLTEAWPELGKPVGLGRKSKLDPTPCVRLVVGPKARSELFAIDTGMTSLTGGTLENHLFSECVSDGSLKGFRDAAFVGAIRSFQSAVGRMQIVRMGEFESQGVTFLRQSANSLGMAYWSRFICTFDFKNNKAYFKKSSTFDSVGLMPLSGLSLRRASDKTVVRDVQARSPGGEAGLKKEDEIVEIDGKPVKGQSLAALRRLLARENRVVSVTILRGGVEHKMEIRLPRIGD